MTLENHSNNYTSPFVPYIPYIQFIAHNHTIPLRMIHYTQKEKANYAKCETANQKQGKD